MSQPINGSSGEEITSPPSKTAGEQDHSDPWQFAGEDAPPPTNESSGARDGQGPEGEV